jgi:hypothetical protein
LTHTLERAKERGTSAKEIKEVIETGFAIPARYGREGKAKVYDFKRKRQGKYYEQKRVEVIFTIEDDTIYCCYSMCFMGDGKRTNEYFI